MICLCVTGVTARNPRSAAGLLTAIVATNGTEHSLEKQKQQHWKKTAKKQREQQGQ